MKKIYLILVILIIQNTFLYSQDDDRPISHRVQQGLTFLNRNDFATAITCFNNALRENPSDGDAYYYRGNAYLEIGEYQKALDDFNTFLRGNNINVRFWQILPTWLNRGDAYLKLQNFEDALYNFNHYIITMTEHLNMAEIMGSSEEVIRTFKNGIAYCYLLRGRTFNSMRDIRSALSDFSNAINLDVYEKSVFLDRGVIYYQLEQYENAISDILIYLNNDPNIIPKLGHYYANYYLAKCYALTENYQEAINHITAAIAVEQRDAYLYYYRGIIYIALMEYEKAKDDLLRATTLEPTNEEYLNKWILAVNLSNIN